MSSRAVQIEFKINFPVVLFTVLLIHALLLAWHRPELLKPVFVEDSSSERSPLRIRDIKTIRTVGARDTNVKDSVYLSKNDSKTKSISKERIARVKSDARTLSLNDLSLAGKEARSAEAQAQRPGSRPEETRPKAITGISLKGQEMRKFAQGGSAPATGGDSTAQSFSNSDVFVNLEVPEGVSPDELNKYELMFYGFQRRTAINYVNSFYKNLDKFQQANPHLTFPMTESKQVMTGRLTYDSKGNIKQIKMIRWTNVDKLQNFFLDVLKDMDTLHNPPTALWEKTGEFSIYFSFIVNG